jgi:tetratricopeptide (TPR) repeat protein
VRLLIGDGKNLVRWSKRTYDVILNDSTYPGLVGSSDLYSLDHFLACRERLSPEGIISSWLPLDMSPEGLRITLSTFAEAFPEASLWLAANCRNKHALLVGRKLPMPVSYSVVADRLEGAVAGDLAEIGLDRPEILLSSFLCDGHGMVRAGLLGAEVHRDERPVLEYLDPRYRVRQDSEGRWAQNLAACLEAGGKSEQSLPNSWAVPAGDRPAMQRSLATARRLHRGVLSYLRGEEGLIEACRERRQVDPGNPLPDRLLKAFEGQLELAARADPVGLKAVLAKARTFSRAGDLAGAEEQFRRALELAPESAAIRNELGVVLSQAGKLAQALEVFAEAATLAPDDPEILHNQGRAFLLKGLHQEAAGAFARAADLAPGQLNHRRMLGFALFESGSYAEAAEVFRAVLAERPDDRRVQEYLERAEQAVQ